MIIEVHSICKGEIRDGECLKCGKRWSKFWDFLPCRDRYTTRIPPYSTENCLDLVFSMPTYQKKRDVL